MRNPYTPNRMAEIKSTDNTKWWRESRETESVFLS